MQKNLIFRIAVDILQNINFFKVFTALANVPIIYIQQFWNTLSQDAKSEALEITPVDSAHPFVSPPAGELVMDFMNELGYPGELISSLESNYVVDQPQYLEMAARKPTAKERGKKKTVSKAEQPKKPTSVKQSKPTPAKQTKLLVDEEEAQPAPEPHVEDDEYNMQRGVTRSFPVVEGKRKGIATDEQAAHSLLELHKLKKQNAEAGAEKERSDGETDTEILDVAKEQGEDVSNTVALEERTVELDEGQAGSNPDKTPESRPPPEHVIMEEDQAGSDPGKSHVALAGPNPEPMHDGFVATVYPQVHESLKHTTEEHVHIENPLSSSGTLSSMKNLDPITFGDQLINDKSAKEELRKANMEAEVESMVTVPIHQASSSVPPLSTPVIDLSPPK
ncbi:hypothetical protein Tco_0503106 [Tanacetum coccineum]